MRNLEGLDQLDLKLGDLLRFVDHALRMIEQNFETFNLSNFPILYNLSW
jgi:hypothetical protein